MIAALIWALRQFLKATKATLHSQSLYLVPKRYGQQIISQLLPTGPSFILFILYNLKKFRQVRSTLLAYVTILPHQTNPHLGIVRVYP